MSLATVILPILSIVEDGFQVQVFCWLLVIVQLYTWWPIIDRLAAILSQIGVNILCQSLFSQPALTWMKTYWSLSILLSLIYVGMVFTLHGMMRSRTPFGLRKVLVMWNTGLAVFSLIGATSIIPDIIQNLHTNGVVNGNCLNDDDITWKRAIFWTWLFGLSKVIELGDTVFIVLRKTPLICLHWYHHVTVLVYTWYGIKNLNEFCMLGVGMNYFVHTIMYVYYALRASGVRLSANISQVITLLQITQMIVGIVVCLLGLAHSKHRTFEGCDVNYTLAYLGIFMYVSYMVLFANFFYQRYVRKRK